MIPENPALEHFSHAKPQQYLYPPLEPYAQGFLAVDSLHTLYWEQSGNPAGVPVVFLHGGPGAGCGPAQRRFFDPAFYRIVLFDQRGAGRSTPLGEIRNNTTPLLIQDLESLRIHLAVERWLVFGGSWGSTLALAYAQVHPLLCLGLILRGIFLCRPSEIEWFLYGMRTLFPEAWQEFSTAIPPGDRADLLTAYQKHLNHPDPAVHLPAARNWGKYEAACSTLLPNPELMNHFTRNEVALALARIEAHYFSNSIFLPPDSLLSNLEQIRTIPGTIIQGRYDAVCPIITASELHQRWPEASYHVISTAGHSAFEPGIAQALVRSTDDFRAYLRPGNPG